MQTASCCLPVVIPTHRPLALRWFDRLKGWLQPGFQAAPTAPRAEPLEWSVAPDGLSAETLRDIGFASWQVEQRELTRLRDTQRWLW